METTLEEFLKGKVVKSFCPRREEAERQPAGHQLDPCATELLYFPKRCHRPREPIFNAMATVLRDIPSLKVTVLKEIAKVPTKCVTEARLRRALKVGPESVVEGFDLAQTLVDYITEAGRFTDDVLPPWLFKAGRPALRLKNSKISGKYLGRIVDSVGRELVELDVSGTFQIDDAAVAYVLDKCSKLRSLNIRNCRKITDATLDVVVAKGGQLTALDIGGDVNISAAGVRALVGSKKMGALRELNLSGLPVRDDVLSVVAKGGQRLAALGIGFTDVGEGALREFLVQRGAQLERLGLHWLCASATSPPETQLSAEFVFEFLAQHCPRLTDLDVSGQKHVSAPALQQFVDAKLAAADAGRGVALVTLKAKFIGSSRALVEQVVGGSHPYLKLEA